MKKLLLLSACVVSNIAVAAEDPWKYGVMAYDTKGEPYTGIAYLTQDSITKVEFENGIKKSELIDVCVDGECIQEINGYEHRVLSVTKDGIPLEGTFEERVDTLEENSEIKQHRIRGRYVQGVPDGLQQEFDQNDKLILEKMMDKGRYVWTKAYSHNDFNNTDITDETIYENGGVITKRKYENDKLVSEEKSLFDGRKGYSVWYTDGKLTSVQEYKQNGTSVYKDYINKKEIELNAYEKYDPETGNKFVEYGKDRKVVIAGKRDVCWIMYPFHETNDVGCSKNLTTESMGQKISMTSAQQAELVVNPKLFFDKNELGLDMSDVGNLNLRVMNENLKKAINHVQQTVQDVKVDSPVVNVMVNTEVSQKVENKEDKDQVVQEMLNKSVEEEVVKSENVLKNENIEVNESETKIVQGTNEDVDKAVDAMMKKMSMQLRSNASTTSETKLSE